MSPVYEEVYLKAYESVAEARREIGRYFTYFDSKRRHSGLGRRTPNQVFFQTSDLANLTKRCTRPLFRYAS